MRTRITLMSDSFKYPTKVEREKIRKLTPSIDRFKVEYKSATIGILKNFSVEEAIRSEDIYWWCNCFNNRLGKLTETNIFLQTHYLRVKVEKDKDPQNIYTDKILLDYFIEIFYYYFFSARDVLGQVLNIYYDLKVEEWFDPLFFGQGLV